MKMKFELEPYNRGQPDETLLNDLSSVAASLGKDYVTKEEYEKHGRFSPGTIQKRFGSWCKAHDLARLRKIRHYDTTAEECIEDLKAVAERLGKKTLTRVEYKQVGKFDPELIRRRCGSWIQAVQAAGLTVSPLYHARIPDEELFENLERLWESLGRQPRKIDFDNELSRLSYNLYKKRFGSLRKALEAFVESLDQQQSSEEGAQETSEASLSIQATAIRKHKTSRNINWRLRFLVMRRDNFKCRACGRSPASDPSIILHVDHVKAWSNGGETTIENLQTLCSRCNLGKSNLD